MSGKAKASRGNGHRLGHVVPLDKWRCKLCTFLNDRGATFCAKCKEQAPPPSASSAPSAQAKAAPPSSTAQDRATYAQHCRHRIVVQHVVINVGHDV